jgi:hypothetical protein
VTTGDHHGVRDSLPLPPPVPADPLLLPHLPSSLSRREYTNEDKDNLARFLSGYRYADRSRPSVHDKAALHVRSPPSSPIQDALELTSLSSARSRITPRNLSSSTTRPRRRTSSAASRSTADSKRRMRRMGTAGRARAARRRRRSGRTTTPTPTTKSTSSPRTTTNPSPRLPSRKGRNALAILPLLPLERAKCSARSGSTGMTTSTGRGL